MILGTDLREIATGVVSTDVICFLDNNGILHNIVGAKRVRQNGVTCLIFNESNPNVELHLDAPPKELVDRINQFYDDNEI